MATKMRVRYGLVLVIVCGMMLTSCAGKTCNAEYVAEQELLEQQRLDEAQRLADDEAELLRLATEEEDKQEEARLETERLAREEAEAEQKAQAQADFLDIYVYFEFESFVLTAESMEILDAKVAWLNANLDAKITMEGYCDSRGTREYNLIQGERRAQAAKKYLVDNGISEDRIATISYGEGRPLDMAKDDAGWAKNRRVQAVIR